MATLSNRRGSRVIQFTVDGQRRTITLGRCDKSTAQTIRTHVGRLVVAAITNTAAPADTANWLAGLSDRLHQKLVTVDLVPPREQKAPQCLEAMLDTYVKRRTDLKPRPRYNLERAKQSLCDFFGRARDPRTINVAEAGDYRRSLATEHAQATVSGRIKKARQMFADAFKRKLIEANPFAGVKAGAQSNRDRMRYIPVADIERVISACRDHEWRLTFALARYAGVRVPAEINGMLW